MRHFDELRAEAAEVDGAPVLRGYAVKYGARSKPIPLGNGRSFVEEFRAGAFADYLQAGNDVVALFNHDSGKPLARLSAGTLKIEDRSDGLYYEIMLPSTSYAADLMESVKRGDVRGSSFRFVKQADELHREEKQIVRVVTRATLVEVSPVTFPAYPSSSVEARALPDDLVARVKAINFNPRITRAQRMLRLMQVS